MNKNINYGNKLLNLILKIIVFSHKIRCAIILI